MGGPSLLFNFEWVQRRPFCIFRITVVEELLKMQTSVEVFQIHLHSKGIWLWWCWTKRESLGEEAQFGIRERDTGELNDRAGIGWGEVGGGVSRHRYVPWFLFSP